MGYTRFKAEKDGVKVHLKYFIGSEEDAMVWNIKITNASKKQKNLSKAQELELRVQAEGKFTAKVSQFVFPTGQRQEVTTKLPIDSLGLYEAMTAAGCHFEAEFLSRSEASVTINSPGAGKKPSESERFWRF